jgi:RHS repeat-associated protein
MRTFILSFLAFGALLAGSFHGEAMVMLPDWALIMDDAKDHGCIKTAANLSQECGDCPKQSRGMPSWWVSEPFINLWVADEPVAYTTSLGEEMVLRMSYKQRNRRTFISPYIATNSWTHNWNSCVHVRSTTEGPNQPYFAAWEAILMAGDGGEYYFSDGSDVEPSTGMKLSPMDGTSTHMITQPSVPESLDLYGKVGVRLVYPDGSQDLFGKVTCTTNFYEQIIDELRRWTNGYTAFDALLTEHIDPYGNRCSFSYTNYGLLYFVSSMVDYDGRTTTFTYNSNRLTRVDMPYGRSATFSYNSYGLMTSILDAAGMNSLFSYDPNSLFLTSINNQFHGLTKFGHQIDDGSMAGTVYVGNAGGSNRVNRAIEVTHPDNSKEVYLYRYESAQLGIPASLSQSMPVVPQFTLDAVSVEPGYAFYRNSYHWDRKQCAELPQTTNTAAFTAADYALCSTKHWLINSQAQAVFGFELTSLISWEREASPTGSSNYPGQVVCYDYVGKPANAPWLSGTDQRLAVVARQAPDHPAESAWTYTQYHDFGLPSQVESTYTTPAGSTSTRITTFNYAQQPPGLETCSAFGTNLLSSVTWTVPMLTSIVGPDGQSLLSIPDAVTYTTNTVTRTKSGTNYVFTTSFPRRLTVSAVMALTKTNTVFFNARQQVVGILRANGVSTITTYGANGFLLQSRDLAADLTPIRTNTFAYTNGLLSARTNELGLQTGYTWDSLQRPTAVIYPDLTSNTWEYSGQNLSVERDRRGASQSANYNNFDQMQSFTDRNGNTTHMTYCSCGDLETLTDPLGVKNTYYRDNNGRLTQLVYAGEANGFVTFNRNKSGQVTNLYDSAGLNLTYTYNNQGLLTNIQSSVGTAQKIVYDVYDRPITNLGPEGIALGLVYDGLGRILYRTLNDSRSEEFVYGPNGLNTYFDPLRQATHYGYDSAGLLKSVTNANGESMEFGYDPAGNLTSLTDGRNNKTSWAYDIYGHQIREANANNLCVSSNLFDLVGQVTSHWTREKGIATLIYDLNGNLTEARYSGVTNLYPAMTNLFRYDPLNRLTNAVDVVGNHVWSYTSFGAFNGAMQSEDGPWLSDTVSQTYANHLRTGLSIAQPSGTWSQSISYDALLRARTLATPDGAYTYNYAGAGGLVQSLSLPGGVYITNTFDTFGQLRSTSLKDQFQNVLNYHGYDFDGAGYRENSVRTNSYGQYVRVEYGFDHIGQLTSASGFEASGTARLNEKFTCAYDKAGNLLSRANGALIQTFSSDKLNQLTDITRNALLTVAGQLSAAATNATVNGQSAAIYNDWTFASSAGVSLSDGSNTFSISAKNWQGQIVTQTTSANLPSSITLLYDSNGNLTNDGLRNFEYDAMDRLTAVTVSNAWRSEFAYDGLSRLRVRQEKTWQAGAFTVTNEVRYVYLGRQVLQERDGSNVPKVTYTRGLDLSGSWGGSGGIGGVLARNDVNGTAFYHADGMGNVTALVSQQGQIKARYVYDPFGNLVAKSGYLADANLYRFSSKELHPNSGMYYYGFRFYEPTLQRWVNKDPLGIRGGLNLHAAFFNNPMRFVDRDGLDNIYNMPAGQNAVPDIVASMATAGGGLQSGYKEGIDPLFLLAGMTPFDPNQLLSLPQPLSDLVELASDSSTGYEKLDAATGLVLWAFTKGKVPKRPKLPKPLRKPCRVAKGGTYRLLSAEGDVMKTGRTKDLSRREKQLSKEHPHLEFEVDKRTDDYAQQRGREEVLYNEQNPPAPLDKIRPISPRNLNAARYRQAAEGM